MEEPITKVILAELATVRNIFRKVYDKKIMDNTTDLKYIFPTGTNYFTILEANADKIGDIGDKKFLNNIIEAYVLSKYFIDCIRANNLNEINRKQLKDAYLSMSYSFDKMKNLFNIE